MNNYSTTVWWGTWPWGSFGNCVSAIVWIPFFLWMSWKISTKNICLLYYCRTHSTCNVSSKRFMEYCLTLVIFFIFITAWNQPSGSITNLSGHTKCQYDYHGIAHFNFIVMSGKLKTFVLKLLIPILLSEYLWGSDGSIPTNEVEWYDQFNIFFCQFHNFIYSCTTNTQNKAKL